MKAKFIKHILIKADEGKYFLFKEDETGFRLQVCNKLSKQHCDELFGVVDVEKLAKMHHKLQYIEAYNPDIEPYVVADYTAGFNKAMELNKDKVFTVEQIIEAFEAGRKRGMDWELGKNNTHPICSEFIQSLQQPTEIEVTFDPEEKDSEGCLVLKRV